MSIFIDSLIRTGRFDFAAPRRDSPDTTIWFDSVNPVKFDELHRVYSRGTHIQINGFTLNAVAWYPHHITISKLNKKTDAISFNFTGCVMAVFDLDGERYAAHIQCAEGDCKQKWVDFVRTRKAQVCAMFRPDAERHNAVYRQCFTSDDDVWLLGVITPDLECYSVCVKGGEFERQHFTVGFIEQHPMPFQVGGYAPVLNPQGDISAAWDAFWNSYQPRTVYPAVGAHLVSQPVKKSYCL